MIYERILVCQLANSITRLITVVTVVLSPWLPAVMVITVIIY